MAWSVCTSIDRYGKSCSKQLVLVLYGKANTEFAFILKLIPWLKASNPWLLVTHDVEPNFDVSKTRVMVTLGVCKKGEELAG